MKPEVHEALGDILGTDAGPRLDAPQVDDAFMGDEPTRPRVNDREMWGQPMSYVVGIEDGHLRRSRQAVATHHRDIGPGDRKDRGRSPRCGRDDLKGLWCRGVDTFEKRMARQE